MQLSIPRSIVTSRPNKSKDVFVCVQKEVDGGIIVSGAKVVATSAAMTHYNFMGQSSKPRPRTWTCRSCSLSPSTPPA